MIIQQRYVPDTPIDSIQEHPDNARAGDEDMIDASLNAHGFYGAVLVQQSTGHIIVGNHRHRRLKAAGSVTIPTFFVDVDDDEALRILLNDNPTSDAAGYRVDELTQLLERLATSDRGLAGTGFESDDLARMLAELNPPAPPGPVPPSVALADRFIVPPFSVLDARQGYWQDRKERWASIGLRSEEGRDADQMAYATSGDNPVSQQIRNLRGGTSIFDPALCEVLLTWFSRPGGKVLDPFAGGSVRGIVSALLGRPYTGVDLSAAQVAANVAQAQQLCNGGDLLGGACSMPRWVIGDSRDVAAGWPGGGPFDMILTCPPYNDLEQYSDDPRDLSRAGSSAMFGEALGVCMGAAAAQLADDRFAVVVMGEARDRRGDLQGLVPATIRAAEAAGLRYYNEAILVTPVGTNAVRAPGPFIATRKVVRGHQTVLVFVKGSAVRAVDWCGPVQIAPDA